MRPVVLFIEPAAPASKRPQHGIKALAGIVASGIDWMMRRTHGRDSARGPFRAVAPTAKLPRPSAAKVRFIAQTPPGADRKANGLARARLVHAYGASAAAPLCAAATWSELAPEPEVTCPACLRVLRERRARAADEARRGSELSKSKQTSRLRVI